MRRWIPAGFALLAVLAVGLFYAIDSTGAGANSFSLVNAAGLVAVVVGVLAAGILLRRATPP